MIRRLGFVFGFILLAFSYAHATEEICGDGIDNDSSGGDASCPSPDADHDGYNTNGSGSGYDCDDTDRRCYAGLYCSTGLAAGHYHLCQTNGTFGTNTDSAVTPLCEAAGSGSCYYVNFVSGSDTTGTGTYALPWKTLRMVGHWDSGAPSGHVNPANGSVVYLVGSGTYTDTYNTGANGTKTVEIAGAWTLKRYPGADVGINAGGVSSVVWSAANVHITDLDIVNGGERGISGYGANVEIARNTVHGGTTGDGNNNVGCITANGTAPWIHHNTTYDCYSASGNTENVSDILIFGDTAIGAVIERNVAYYTAAWSAGGINHGHCIMIKHGAAQSAIPTYIIDNDMWNCGGESNGAAIYAGTSSLRIQRNLILDSERVFAWTNVGGTPYAQDILLEYNTSKNTDSFMLYNPEVSSGSVGTLTVRFNVFSSAKASYGADEGIYRVWNYGNSTQYADIITGHKISSNSNCWYNTPATATWDLFNGMGAPGAQYAGLTAWQAAGFDALSTVENPTFDSSHRATSTNCRNFGYIRTTDEALPSVGFHTAGRFGSHGRGRGGR